MKDDDFKIKTTPINNDKIPYEHVINLIDPVPIATQATQRIPRSVRNYLTVQWCIFECIKRDGSVRLCCDYRDLIQKRYHKHYPIARREGIKSFNL